MASAPVASAAAPVAPDTDRHEVDITVVGAGPVGLYAAYYAGFRGLRVAVVDTLDEVGGQVTALYPEKAIHDVAGFVSVRGADLVDRLLRQAGQFAPTLLLGRQANGLAAHGGGHLLTLADGTSVRSRAVLLCAGLGSMEPKPLPAAKGWGGTGLVYNVARLSDLDDRDVVVVGGGDSAVDWANAAVGRARTVAVVHRRTGFRAHAAGVDQLQAGGVSLLLDSEVTALDTDPTGRVRAVAVTNTVEGTTATRPCDLLVAALGFTTKLGPVTQWGLAFEGRHVKVGPDMQTSVPGVYAAGDVSEYPGKVRLISVGFGEAAIAVNHLAAALDPSAQVFPGHSTHLGS